MVSLRDRVVAIFEKHRIAPGTPYEEDHFPDFLLPHPQKARAVYDSLRGLRGASTPSSMRFRMNSRSASP
jgi:hypothetical protein